MFRELISLITSPPFLNSAIHDGSDSSFGGVGEEDGVDGGEKEVSAEAEPEAEAEPAWLWGSPDALA